MDLYHHVYTFGNKPFGWESVLDDAQKSFMMLCQGIEALGLGYTPRKELVLAALCVPLESVRVVIVGQDPFPSNATGFAFSSREIKPSHRAIFAELQRSIPGFVIPNHGDLTSWCQEGVLLLNMDLTTAPGKSGTHKGLSGGVMHCIVRALQNGPRKVIWVLWGQNSQKIGQMLGDDALILKAAHPSPLNRTGGFVGCDHFSKINTYFVSHGELPIWWHLPPVAHPPRTVDLMLLTDETQHHNIDETTRQYTINIDTDISDATAIRYSF